MEELFRKVPEHAFMAMTIAFVALLLLYFLFSKLVKLALILILVAIVLFGYVYFQKPGQRPANFKEAVEQVRAGAVSLVEKGKRAYQGGRELVASGQEKVEKGKELLDKGRSVVSQGIDKGKQTVDRGKEAAAEIGKRLGGEEKGER